MAECLQVQFGVPMVVPLSNMRAYVAIYVGSGAMEVRSLETSELLRRLRGHEAPVLQVDPFEGDRRLASASLDGAMKIWDMEVGECVETLRDESTGPISAVRVYGGGRGAIVGSVGGAIRVWDLVERRVKGAYQQGGARIACIRVMRDERRFVVGSFDERESIVLWSLGEEEAEMRFEGHTGRVTSLEVYDDDGEEEEACVISASEDRTLRIWHVQTGRCLRVLSEHQYPVQCARVFGRGERCISGSLDGLVCVWDLTESEENTLIMILSEQRGSVLSILVVEECARLLVYTMSGELTVWDMIQNACLEVKKVELADEEVESGVRYFFPSPRVLIVWDERDEEGLSRIVAWANQISSQVAYEVVHDAGAVVSRYERSVLECRPFDAIFLDGSLFDGRPVEAATEIARSVCEGRRRVTEKRVCVILGLSEEPTESERLGCDERVKLVKKSAIDRTLDQLMTQTVRPEPRPPLKGAADSRRAQRSYQRRFERPEGSPSCLVRSDRLSAPRGPPGRPRPAPSAGDEERSDERRRLFDPDRLSRFELSLLPLELVKLLPSPSSGLSSARPGELTVCSLIVLHNEFYKPPAESTTSAVEWLRFLNGYAAFTAPSLDDNGEAFRRLSETSDQRFFLQDGEPRCVLAVRRAVQWRLKLDVLFANEFYPVSSGIGVDVGTAAVGLAGDGERSTLVVCGEATSLAQKLGLLCQNYGCSILVSERTMSCMGRLADQFCTRRLDKIEFGHDSLWIYEVLDADPAYVRNSKMEAVKTGVWDRALEKYQSRDWQAALGYFKTCLDIYTHDRAAAAYAKICQERSQPPLHASPTRPQGTS